MANQDWEVQAKIEGANSRISILGVLFWIWGVGGLVINGFNFLSLSGSVGVGTSAYISLGILFWIGGMILFGLGSVMWPSDFEFKRPVESGR